MLVIRALFTPHKLFSRHSRLRDVVGQWQQSETDIRCSSGCERCSMLECYRSRCSRTYTLAWICCIGWCRFYLWCKRPFLVRIWIWIRNVTAPMFCAYQFQSIFPLPSILWIQLLEWTTMCGSRWWRKSQVWPKVPRIAFEFTDKMAATLLRSWSTLAKMNLTLWRKRLHTASPCDFCSFLDYRVDQSILQRDWNTRGQKIIGNIQRLEKRFHATNLFEKRETDASNWGHRKTTAMTRIKYYGGSNLFFKNATFQRTICSCRRYNDPQIVDGWSSWPAHGPLLSWKHLYSPRISRQPPKNN